RRPRGRADQPLPGPGRRGAAGVGPGGHHHALVVLGDRRGDGAAEPGPAGDRPRAVRRTFRRRLAAPAGRPVRPAVRRRLPRGGGAAMSTPTPVTTAATGAARWYRRRPAAWVHPGFRRLALAWVFTNLADSALYLMVAVWVKEITGSDGAAALVFALLGVPAFVAPFLGTVADRVSRRRLLVGAYTGIALVVASLFLVQSAAWLALLYAVVVAYGAVGYLTAAAQSGLLRDLLPDEHLASGNGLLSTIDQSLRLVSPVLGAGLYALVGPRAVVALTVVSFALAGLVLLTVRVRESEPEAASERGSYRVELSAGVRHLARTPVL